MRIRDHTTPAAAERWLADHGDSLYRYAVRRVRDPHAAEDLVQETLLAAMTSTRGWSALSAERTWLIGILRHKLVDHLRRSIREKPQTELQFDDESDIFDRNGRWRFPVSEWRGDPRETAENEEFRKVLASCLSGLPPRTAQVFLLHEAESMSSADLCKELGISPTNVWTLLHRARVRLRRCLSRNWFESGAR